MITSGVISQKKKKKSIPVWMQDVCSFRPENDTKCAAEQVLTFFFFLGGITPVFFFFSTSPSPSALMSTSEVERPDFGIKIIGWAHKFGLVQSGRPLSRFLLFEIW